jgi:hypothetical protein
MVVLGSLFLASHHGSGTEARPDLSSPRATMRAYCQAEDPSLIRQLFHPDLKLEEGMFRRPIWTECKVIKVGKTKLLDKPLGGGLVTMRGDTEVVTEVKMIDPAKGNPKTRFWHLLRNLKGEWKIISLSHIPDKNYPPQN